MTKRTAVCARLAQNLLLLNCFWILCKKVKKKFRLFTTTKNQIISDFYILWLSLLNNECQLSIIQLCHFVNYIERIAN